MSDFSALDFSLCGLHFHLGRRVEQQHANTPQAIPPGSIAMYEVERQYDDEGNIAVYIQVEGEGRPDGQPGFWYVNAADPKNWMTAESLGRRKASGKDAGWIIPSVKVD